MAPRRPVEGPSSPRRPKRAPGQPKRAPRRPKGAPKGPPRRPGEVRFIDFRRLADAPVRPRDSLMTAPDGLKTPSQTTPHRDQVLQGTRGSQQRGPRKPTEAFKRRPGGLHRSLLFQMRLRRRKVAEAGGVERSRDPRSTKRPRTSVGSAASGESRIVHRRSKIEVLSSRIARPERSPQAPESSQDGSERPRDAPRCPQAMHEAPPKAPKASKMLPSCPKHPSETPLLPELAGKTIYPHRPLTPPWRHDDPGGMTTTLLAVMSVSPLHWAAAALSPETAHFYSLRPAVGQSAP